ncbi:hypothetical protein [Hufsiella ginkgonis]|uniref:Uncharacterized protein n=1 Tax=Hufsiella ginkgonis TaxID=2695274 RepID=A0A7K1XUE0_9SPHI|nr:hypothetical protein [Hufsiella ginkgonis]MXV14417.1 hypothetical protein [Hufsiella ginkgonis]
MAKAIKVNLSVTRTALDKKLEKLEKKRKPIDLDKYAGKVNFGVDGLEYQLKVRDEWRSGSGRHLPDH